MTTIFVGVGSGILLSETLGGGEAVSLMGFFLPFLIFGSVFLLGIVYVMYGIVGPVRTFQGHDFHYALIGRWIERYLARDAAEG
jgi:uncharacterized Tic20 family protein